MRCFSSLGQHLTRHPQAPALLFQGSEKHLEPHPQRLKWPCWRNVKCSFTNEDKKSSLYPAQQHGGTNTVSCTSGNHAPASPFRSHSTQTAGRWDGWRDDNTATAGKQWFQNCNPRGGRGASLFQTASLLTYSSAKWTVAKPLHYPERSGMPHKSAGAQERGKKYSKIRKCTL